MASFNNKIRSLNSEMVGLSSKLNEFHSSNPKMMLSPQVMGKTKTVKGFDVNRRDRQVPQEGHNVDELKEELAKQVHVLQSQLSRAKKEHLLQISRLQGDLDRCIKEKSALSKSLESSERIRQQQKTLISLLQQGNHTGMGVVENVPEDGSLTPSILAENHMWLNPGSKTDGASIVSGLSETASEGESLSRRRKGNRKSFISNKIGGNGVAFRTGPRSADAVRPSSAPFPRGNGCSQIAGKPPLRGVPVRRSTRSTKGSISGSGSPIEGQDSGVSVEGVSLAQRQREYSAQLAYGSSNGRQKTTAASASPVRRRTAVAGTPSRASSRAATASTPSRRARTMVQVPGTPSSVQRCTFGSR